MYLRGSQVKDNGCHLCMCQRRSIRTFRAETHNIYAVKYYIVLCRRVPSKNICVLSLAWTQATQMSILLCHFVDLSCSVRSSKMEEMVTDVESVSEVHKLSTRLEEVQQERNMLKDQSTRLEVDLIYHQCVAERVQFVFYMD